MKTLLKIIILIFVIQTHTYSQCNPALLITKDILPRDTDPLIAWGTKKHQTYYNPSCNSRNILLIHISGTYDKPSNTKLFPKLAGNNGFHVINIVYPNAVAAKIACAAVSDSTCYINFRKEIIEGYNYSTRVSVDSTNCINNRIIKLIQYMHITNPTEKWNSFYTNDSIHWNKIIVSGHSQGGGHAAVIGMLKPVRRVLMFGSPNDYNTFYNRPAPWTYASKVTHDSLYYGFNNVFDNVVPFSQQFKIWNNLGMPVYGDTTNVDVVLTPFTNSRQLFTKMTSTVANANHSLMILDSKTPLTSGVPLFKPVWRYMLGYDSIPLVIAGINEKRIFNLNVEIYPNPITKNDMLNLKGIKPNDNLLIRDVLGKEIYKAKGTTEINVSNYNKGIYFLTVISHNKIQTLKFIVK